MKTDTGSRDTLSRLFPISRDPPEGGTSMRSLIRLRKALLFPISRDPPEGGTPNASSLWLSFASNVSNF